MESGKKHNLKNCTEIPINRTKERCGNLVEEPEKLSNSIRRQLRRKRAKNRLRNNLETSSDEIQSIEFVSSNIAPKIIGVQPKVPNDPGLSFDFAELLGKKHEPSLDVPQRERGDSLVISSKLTKKIERKRTSRIRRSLKKDDPDTISIKNPNDNPYPTSTAHHCSHNRLDIRLPLVGNENLHHCSYSGRGGGNIIGPSSSVNSSIFEQLSKTDEITRKGFLVTELEKQVGQVRHLLDTSKQQSIRLKTEDEINATADIKMSDKVVKDRATILAEREAKKQAKKTKKTVLESKIEPNKLVEQPIVDSTIQCVDQVDFLKTQDTPKTDLRKKPAIKHDLPNVSRIVHNLNVENVKTPPMATAANQVNTNLDSKQVIKQENLTDDCKQILEKNEEGKSKAELRAERRAKQEAQRAAKAAATTTKDTQKVVDTQKSKTSTTQEKKVTTSGTSSVTTPVKHALTTIKKTTISPLQHKAQILFNHLYIDRDQRTAHVTDIDGIHPSMIRIGIQYQKGIIFGSNSRCIAMLVAIKDMVKDFKTPLQSEYARGLETTLKKCVQYLHSCRPVSVSMTNALRFFKFQLTLLPNNVTDEQASNILTEAIHTYIKEQIEMAGQAISITVQPKIVNGDTILTYGCSSLIKHILLDAHHSGKNFRVVVVDSRPFLEGKEMLRHLVSAGIKCTYVLIATTSFIMASVSKVLLGAHALLANGYVMSRTGTAQVALMAKAHNVPVLVCCETYKFCERVQTDSFVYNEIADPDRLLINKNEGSTNESDTLSTVIPLSLTYDVTPSDLVTAVVTELAILPCTSVPVILRIKPTDSY